MVEEVIIFSSYAMENPVAYLACLYVVHGQTLGEALPDIVQYSLLHFIIKINFNVIIYNMRLNHMWMRYYPLLKGRLDTIIDF